MLDPNFRLVHFHEAEKCLAMVAKCDIREPEFWANLLGAVVNTNIASIPDSVVEALIQEAAADEKRKREFRAHVDRAVEKSKARKK